MLLRWRAALLVASWVAADPLCSADSKPTPAEELLPAGLRAARELEGQGRIAEALKHALGALGEASDEPLVHVMLGRLYASSRMFASASVFFSRALELNDAMDEALEALEALPQMSIKAAEAELEALTMQLISAGHLDMGVRADLERIAIQQAGEGADLNAVRDSLCEASLLLLTSGLGSHATSITRALLAGGELVCAACEAPPPFEHNGREIGVSAAAVQRYIGCCLRESRAVEGLVVSLNASASVANDYGLTPLHFAALNNQPDLVRSLAAHGGSLSARSMFGATPLHAAATRNATDALVALLELPGAAEVGRILDETGRTAAGSACKLGFAVAAELLEPGRRCKQDVREHRNVGVVECGIDVLRADTTSATELVQYMVMGKPLLIRGAASGLGPFFGKEEWTGRRLRAAFGDLPVDVGDIPHASAFGLPSTPTTLAAYLKQLEAVGRGGARGGSGGVGGVDGGVGRGIVFETFDVTDLRSPARGFRLVEGSVLDPEVTALEPSKLSLMLGPRGSGAPMRYARAGVDVLVRGERTWLMQAPSEATFSPVHPADLTETAPWPWSKETLYACDQEEGDLMFVPDGWSRATINNKESLSLYLQVVTGVDDFSASV